MPQCSPVRFQKRWVCIGDLDRRIALMSRSIDPPTTGVDFQHTFTETNVWAAVKTVKGKEIFAGTNMDKQVTHIFYVRYRNWITAENWVKYRDENYDIIDTEVLEEREQYTVLMCNIRGDDTQPVNEA